MKFKLRNILESKPLLLKIFLMLVIGQFSYAQEVGILKYDGGGDWYANPTAVPNLIRFCNENIRTNIDEKQSLIRQFPLK